MRKNVKAITRKLKPAEQPSEFVRGKVFDDSTEIVLGTTNQDDISRTSKPSAEEDTVPEMLTISVPIEAIPENNSEEAVEIVEDPVEDMPDMVTITIDTPAAVQIEVQVPVEDVKQTPITDEQLEAVHDEIFGGEGSKVPEDNGTLDIDALERKERAELVEEITNYVTICGYMQDHIDRTQHMTISELREYAYTIRINSGGSVTMAQLLAETEEDYLKFMSSQDVQRKVALAEAKGADFINVAQRVASVLGSDIVINGMRYAEYHQLVKQLVTHVSVVQHGITSFADMLKLEIPERLLLGGETLPVVEGMPLNTKSTLYILNVVLNNVRVWHAASKQNDEMLRRVQQENDGLQAIIKKQAEDNKLMHGRLDAMRKDFASRMSNISGFVLEHARGYLSLKDPEEPLAFNNLTYCDNVQDAILMGSRIGAEDLAQRVFERKSEKFTHGMGYTVRAVIVVK